MDLTEKYLQFLGSTGASISTVAENDTAVSTPRSSTTSNLAAVTPRRHQGAVVVETPTAVMPEEDGNASQNLDKSALRPIDIQYLQLIPTPLSPSLSRSSSYVTHCAQQQQSLLCNDGHHSPHHPQQRRYALFTTQRLAECGANKSPTEAGQSPSHQHHHHHLLSSDGDCDAYEIEWPKHAAFMDVLLCDGGDGGGGALAISSSDFIGNAPAGGGDSVFVGVAGNGAQCGARRSARVYLPPKLRGDAASPNKVRIRVKVGKGGARGASSIVKRPFGDFSSQYAISNSDGVVFGSPGSAGGRTSVCVLPGGERPIVLTTKSGDEACQSSTSFIAVEGQEVLASNGRTLLTWNKSNSACKFQRVVAAAGSRRSNTSAEEAVLQSSVAWRQDPWAVGGGGGGGIAIGEHHAIAAQSSGTPPRLFQDETLHASCLGYPSPLNAFSIRSTWHACDSPLALEAISGAQLTSNVFCYGGGGGWPGSRDELASGAADIGSAMRHLPAHLARYPFGMGGNGGCVPMRVSDIGSGEECCAEDGRDGFCLLLFGSDEI